MSDRKLWDVDPGAQFAPRWWARVENTGNGRMSAKKVRTCGTTRDDQRR